jgi:hypothetical protein
MTADKPSPIGLAMVICDQIIEDKLTNKKSLIGLFNHIGTGSFPCRRPEMCVFVSLTEGRGQSSARLRIVHDADEQIVADLNGPIEFPDIHSVVDMNFTLGGLVFPEPGLYSIEFYCDDALILERRFTLTKLEPPATSKPGA